MAIINSLGQDGGTGTEVLMSTGGTTPSDFLPVGNGELAKIAGADFSTVQHMQNLFHSSGVVFFAEPISDGGSGTIDMTQVQCAIRATDDDSADLLFCTVAAETGIALTDANLNYIYIEYNAGTPQFVATTTKRTDLNTNVPVGEVFRDGTTLYISNGFALNVGDHAALMVKRMQEVNPFARVSGGVLTESGTRNISVTAGDWWEGLSQFSTAAVDTSVAGTFDYYYLDGVGGFTPVLAQTQIDNLQYDDGSGTLATLSNNRYGAHWVYLGAEGDIHVLYGLGDYTLSDATDAGSPGNLPAFFEDHVRLIGKIIIQKSSTTFESVSSVFTTALAVSPVTNHSALAGLQGGTASEYYHLTSAEYNLTGVITGNGASTMSASTITENGVVVAGASNAVASLTVGTNGQVLVGSTAAAPTFATLASSDGSITYATGAGTLGATVTQATETQLGGGEIATQAEVTTGTSDTLLMSVKKHVDSLASPPAIGGTSAAAIDGTTGTFNDVDVDNINIDANTISVTNTNGGLTIKPNGTASLFFENGSAASTMTINGDGQVTTPLQSSFLAYNSVTDSNVTGDGTIFPIEFDTATFNIGSDYSTTTDTYTAPITSKYSFSAQCYMTGILSGHTEGLIRIVTSNNIFTIQISPYGCSASGGTLGLGHSIACCDMDSADTCFSDMRASNSTKVVDVFQGVDSTSFSGRLLG